MKSLIVLVLVSAVMLTGCSSPKDDFADGFVSEFELSQKVTAKMEFSEYDGSVTEINMIITNNTDEQLLYRESFSLQKFDEDAGKWREINFSREMLWQMSQWIILPFQTTTDIIQLKDNFKQPLLPGRYRVVKYIELDGAVTAEFTIK